MKAHLHIIKRNGHREAYDDHKVYASCYAACLDAGLAKESAEKICAEVVGTINAWADGKEPLSSEEIFERVGMEMEALSERAAFMYRTHRDVS